ncbi:hypothetical protein IAR50_003846 [Cryptococcus sp. DSM 104548]
MCFTSSVPSNFTSDGICCFPTDACAALVCGPQNASIIHGTTEHAGDISCYINYTDINRYTSTSNGTDCNGVGCTWKDGVTTSSASASASSSSSSSSASGAALRMGGDMSGVLGIWALTLCLLALAPKKFY